MTPSQPVHADAVATDVLPEVTERTVWVHEPPIDLQTPLKVLLEAVRDRYSGRIGFALVSGSEEVRYQLKQVFPEDIVLPLPRQLKTSPAAYILKLNTRSLFVCGDPRVVDSGIRRAAGRRALPVIALCGGSSLEPNRGSNDQAALEAVERFFVLDGTAERSLARLGVDADKIEAIGPMPDPLESGMAWPGANRFRDQLAPILAQDLKVRRSRRHLVRGFLERQTVAAFDRQPNRSFLGTLAHRVNTLAELAEILGHPRHILCLGNGPSSEDDRLRESTHDCLFRVNDMWLERGFLAEPDMVFTGAKPVIARIRKALFGFRAIDAEGRLVLHALTRRPFRPLRFATIERLLPNPWQHEPDGVRPTNGALMLATAAALQPERLTVSGIDLYSHPSGIYPGNSTSPNAYSLGHSRQRELDYMLSALDAFEGDLTILSENLAREWTAHTNGGAAIIGSGMRTAG